jgi:hypothetical protein
MTLEAHCVENLRDVASSTILSKPTTAELFFLANHHGPLYKQSVHLRFFEVFKVEPSMSTQIKKNVNLNVVI